MEEKQRNETLELIARLVGSEVMDGCVEKTQTNPIGMKETYQFKVEIDESKKEVVSFRSVKNNKKGKWTPIEGGFRELLWNSLELEQVCEQYRESYQTWQKENNGVGYINPRVTDDAERAEGEHIDSPSLSAVIFADSFLEEKHGGVRLLTAEYGKGKTSFCRWFRSHVSRKTEADGAAWFTDAGAETAFPFFFDLNEFRAGDFDEFIANRLVEYKVNLDYDTFELLCRKGYFCVVLDAWDQMHSTPRKKQTFEDIARFSRMWEGKGSMLITCRRTFYLSQLNLKRNENVDDSVIRRARLFTLHGFGKEEAKQYLEAFRRDHAERLPALDGWFDETWERNKPLLSRPLNLHLVAKHFDALEDSVNLTTRKVESDALFSVLLEQWKASCAPAVSGDAALKQLVMLTLRSGLNRGCDLGDYQKQTKLEGEAWKALETELARLDFVKVTPKAADDGKGKIEFRLAAYQEFLWANYALVELNEGRSCNASDLVGRYLLTKEARAWAVKRLLSSKTDCLSRQLSGLWMKNRAETGYAGGNALTLLGDLTRGEQTELRQYYTSQLQSAKLDNRPLNGADLHGLNLNGMNFSSSDLTDADFSYASLEGTNFQWAKLYGTSWDEYGQLAKCAFLEGERAKVVLAATAGGGLLSYHLNDRQDELIALSDEVIQDISADSKGVYTAGGDGQVCYLDRKGTLKNAFITGDSLQSLAASASDQAYVAAKTDGLYRFDRGDMSSNKIQVIDEDGEPVELENPRLIRYSRIDGVRYIALLTKKDTCLTLLELSGGNEAVRVGFGELRYQDLAFEDICFAGDRLVYKVKNRDVYSTELGSFFGKLSDNELLNDEKLLYALPEAAEIAWAGKAERLLVLCKGESKGEKLLSLSLNGDAEERELDWLWENGNYSIEQGEIKDFAAFSDGNTIAVAGNRLAVFSWKEDAYYLQREPVEAHLRCKGAQFRYSEDLDAEQAKTLRERGAVL